MTGNVRRVLLDANVFVSAAIGKGPPYQIVHSLFSGDTRFEVVACPALLTEVAGVLSRPHLTKYLTDGDSETFLVAVTASVEIVDDPVAAERLLRDPDDDYLIAIARSAEVEAIVSGDKDLLEWSTQVPPVLTPSAFLALLDN